jgi:hypothetical protein
MIQRRIFRGSGSRTLAIEAPVLRDHPSHPKIPEGAFMRDAWTTPGGQAKVGTCNSRPYGGVDCKCARGGEIAS